MEIPRAPMAITQNGMGAFEATPSLETASAIAASGPTAFATSFAPCAKLRRAAANIRGMVKSLLIEGFSFASDAECLETKLFTTK